MRKGYSICLNEWALDKDIKNELGLLLIISSLCAEKGYCYASNEYLSKLFNISEVAISQRIKKLEGKGYIEISYTKRGCEVTSRELRLKSTLTDDLSELKPTIKANLKEKSISNNNTSNNIYPPISPQGECLGKGKTISILKDIVANYEGSEQLKKTILDFIEMRETIKKPMSSKALELMLKKLNDLASQEKEKIEILEQSIMSSWQGIFPLRENNKNKTNALDRLLKELDDDE